MFTGVITWEGLVVTYRQVQFGISNDIIPSKRGDEYPFGTSPVYQGFLSYQKLASAVKAEIKKMVDDCYNSDVCINDWIQRTVSYDKQADIIAFLNTIKKYSHSYRI